MTQEEANEKLIETLKELTYAYNNTHGSLSGFNNGLETSAKNLADLDPLQQADAKAKQELAEKQRNVNRALYSADEALQQFSSAFMQNEKSFSKYSSSIESMGDAIANAVKLIPGIGQLASMAVKAVTAAAVATIKQTDNVLKASDQMASFGAAGALSSQQILEMGHRAGLSSDNLQVFTKAAAAAGPGLLSLGSTVGEGIIQFGKLTEVTSEQRQAFQSLGVGQDELMENQAQYIKNQQASGVMITQEMITSGKVQKASLEYTENLLLLSSLTGKSTKELKEKIAVEQSQFQYRIKQSQLSLQADDAEKAGDTVKAAQLRKQQEANEKYLEAAIATGDQQQILAAQSLIATESVTKDNAVNERLEIDQAAIVEKLRKGQDVTVEYQEQYAKGVQRRLKEVGQAGAFNESTAKAYGIAGQGVEFAMRNVGKDIGAAKDKAVAAIGKPAEGEKGTVVSQDDAQKARNTLTETEIAGQVAMDKLVQAVNPLIKGTQSLTTEATNAGKALGILSTNAGKAAATGPAASPATATARPMSGGGGGALAANIAKHESGAAGYNAYNKGTVGNKIIGSDKPIDFSKMTIDEYLKRGNLKSGDPNKIFAVGKYQFTPKTMADLAKKLNLDTKTTVLDSATQDLLFNEGTLKLSKPNVAAYLSGKSNNRDAAILDLAKEFASVGVPYPAGNAKKRGESYYQGIGGNKATNPPDAVGDALDAQRTPKISASLEGIASGPESGYTVKAHGDELIKRLTPNSILDKLAYTPASAAETITTSTSDNSSKILGDLYSLMEGKFDDLIDAINVGNDTSDKLLKYSRV